MAFGTAVAPGGEVGRGVRVIVETVLLGTNDGRLTYRAGRGSLVTVITWTTWTSWPLLSTMKTKAACYDRIPRAGVAAQLGSPARRIHA